MADINTWAGRCKVWSDCSNLTWSEKILVQDIFVAIDGGAIGGGLGYREVPKSHIQKQIKKLTKDQEDRFITVIAKLRGKEYKQTVKVTPKPAIEIEDIEFVIKEVKGIKIKVLKD